LICGKYIRIRKKVKDQRQDAFSVHYDEIPSKVGTPTGSELGRCEEIKLVFVHKNKESVLKMKPVKHSNSTSLEESGEGDVSTSHIVKEIVEQTDDTIDALRPPLSSLTDTDGYMLPVQSLQTETTDDYLPAFR
jgi:hypothetical protein